MLEETVDAAIWPVHGPRGRPGRPRKPPKKLHADKGYDFARCRKARRKRGLKARIARRGVDSSERLGRHRWVVERTLSWLKRLRRLKVCATSGGQTSTRRSWSSGARRSAGATSNGFVKRT